MKELSWVSALKEKVISDEEKQREILCYTDEEAKSHVNQSIIHTREDVILLVSLQTSLIKKTLNK